MSSEELLQRVTIDADICHGQPCIRGTRVLVTVLLDALAAGMSTDEIIRQFPTIEPEDVRAAAHLRRMAGRARDPTRCQSAREGQVRREHQRRHEPTFA
jgi:uncharacterized protein (DUF433 family)